MVKLWWVEEVILTYVNQILLLSSERTGLGEQEVTQEEGKKKKASTSLPTYMSLTVDAVLSFFGGFFLGQLKSLLNGRHQSGLLCL